MESPPPAAHGAAHRVSMDDAVLHLAPAITSARTRLPSRNGGSFLES
jgi:hypothetical protein